MLWIKAFHILFVMSWMAGLFYLPRILINLAMVAPDSTAERDRLLLMGAKLARFTTGLGVVALALGIWLWLGYGITGGWMHAKLALVVCLIGYEHMCKAFLRKFENGVNTKSHRWFRVFNETSVLIAAAIIILVVVKPF
jgi:protoporphyrinogen IX oxidase